MGSLRQFAAPKPGVWFNFEAGEFRGIGEVQLSRWQAAFPGLEVGYALEHIECAVVSAPQRWRGNYLGSIETALRRAHRMAEARAQVACHAAIGAAQWVGRA